MKKVDGVDAAEGLKAESRKSGEIIDLGSMLCFRYPNTSFCRNHLGAFVLQEIVHRGFLFIVIRTHLFVQKL